MTNDKSPGQVAYEKDQEDSGSMTEDGRESCWFVEPECERDYWDGIAAACRADLVAENERLKAVLAKYMDEDIDSKMEHNKISVLQAENEKLRAVIERIKIGFGNVSVPFTNGAYVAYSELAAILEGL